MDYAQAEVLYQITQRMDVQTGLRDQVLEFLARSGVILDEIRIDPEQAIDAAIEAYKRQGKSEKWIEARLQGKVQRLRFTASFRKSMRTDPSQWQYAIITDEMRLGLWKRNTAALRKQMGLERKDNLRGHQSRLAILYEALAEEVSSVDLDQKSDLAFDQAKTIAQIRNQWAHMPTLQANAWVLTLRRIAHWLKISVLALVKGARVIVRYRFPLSSFFGEGDRG